MISFACAIWFGWALSHFGSFNYGQPSAVLWQDQLFVAITAHHNKMLGRGPFTPATRRVHSPIEHSYPILHDNSNQAKIEIRGDRVLLSSTCDDHYIFRMEDVPLLEDSAFGNMLRRSHEYRLREGSKPPDSEGLSPVQKDVDAELIDFARFTRLIHPYRGGRRNLLTPKHRPPDIPLSATRQDDGDKPSEDTYLANVRHDVQIAGPKSVRLFHAYKDKFFVSVEPDYLINWYLDENLKIAKNLPKPPERELRTGKIPADFTEEFAAYTSGKRDYLVTSNGKVYMSAPKGKTEVEVSPVWDDPKQRIMGVVQDMPNDAVYGWGFVTDSSAPERFYVKLGPKPVAVSYKLTVPLWKDRFDAYLESYECARAFRKAAEKK